MKQNGKVLTDVTLPDHLDGLPAGHGQRAPLSPRVRKR